jgi:hypothetical protein
MGDIAERVAGRVVLLGKRIGEVNGLLHVSYKTESVQVLNLRIVQTSHLSQVVNYFISVWPRKVGRIALRPLLNVLRGVFQNEISISLIPSAQSTLSQARYHTLGKVSLSKTKACNNCPLVIGKSSQLPHHQGLSHPLPSFPQIQPSSSARLYANSAARLRAYIEIVTLNWSLG